MTKKALTYAKAGVSLSRGDRLVEKIAPHIKRTLRPEVVGSFGGFAALSKLPKGYRDPRLLVATDGVGTKVLLAKEYQNVKTVGIDLVAMSVNDILTLGGEPFLFLDYFATSHLDVTQGSELIAGVAKGCQQAGCALVGGETAEMPQVYRKGDFDLAGFCVGIVEAKKIVDGRGVKAGDVILGLPSSGVHSNGYSLVRAIIKGKRISATMKKELLRPTQIYVREILDFMKKVTPRGMVHVTGSGIEGNLPRILPKGLSVEIDRDSWRIPKVFRDLQKMGNVSTSEMFSTFNMGIGFIVIVRKRDLAKSLKILKGSRQIGSVLGGRGESNVVWKN